ncbi:Rtf2 RING-finger-domain-containing protein [Catenaria anguillulae PL171]|uniref:Rtf2 RING-finger-domain-containing protein n=1 Tax=Catenaria anguillulae PL171 TaxID=765915 RepID=A0A1Y2HPQ9_9FUNG|nr:Rtf2 RING-finger-domain-containing protein [Catenaria anguillulae PL171]
MTLGRVSIAPTLLLVFMGADGGSIPRRDELVKSKVRAVKHDPSLLAALALYYCSLTKERLSAPIVADDLGKLYNREAIVKHLLDRRAGDATATDGIDEVKHIKSLKDVTTLELTKMSSDNVQDDGTEADNAHKPQFACPLTGRPLNGRHRFVYLRTCGHVMSLAGLRELVPSVGAGVGADGVVAAVAEGTRAECPVCTRAFDVETELIPLNPSQDELTGLVERMVARQAAEAAAKKKEKSASKKRKAEASGSAKTEATSSASKKAKTSSSSTAPSTVVDPAANINMSLPAIPSRSAVGAQQSAAIASLYKKKESTGTSDADKFFVQGTYSRT